LYKLSFYSATFNKLYKNEFSKDLEGIPVREGKDLIKKELLNKIPREELNIIKNMEQILEYILNLTNARMALEY